MEAAEEEVCQCSAMEEKSEKRQTSPVCYRERKQRPWKRSFIYLQCYFLTVATILGTGILGLPVTIARAGLIPFLVSFLVGFLMQALLIYLFVDLLQRCRVIQMESVKSLETEGILMQNVSPVESPVLNSEEVEESEDVEDADAGLLQKDNTILKLQEKLHPNLHVLGVLFLSKRNSQAFTLILLFHFHVYVIPAFTWTLSLGILLAQVIIQPITSLLTLLKGILLIITVVVTFVVGSEVHQETKNDFTQIGKPFLMGTVALGGIVNVMPFLFSEIYHNKTQVLWFRRALLGGLTTCTILNILWCWAVVDIVPQMAVKPVLEEKLLNTSLVRMETTRPAHTFIYSNISLEESEKAGEIATIPLTKIINQRYTHFSWVAELIQIFITISITVSFLVMGSAMKHTIDGLVNRQWEMNAGLMLRTQPRTLPEIFNTLRMRSVSGGFLSFLVFGIIFVVSICDPKGFVVMLDKVVSFSLNTEVGLFIFLMLRASRSVSFNKRMPVPLPVGESLFRLHWLLPVYFLFAVAYDLSLCVLDISKNMYHSSQSNRSLV
ncbi:uncharacterized protein si:ch211-51h4.2 isoform X2 [Tachysurus fulvidraco]|uniref:uncharacterized protein si:ch211-51h4.2 isoform X2 n=1 Tax=Tachysurus fulvidraco TaxID=1234273 RepID=UPI001FEE2137|nr:uncharacterized protein si:ch211-51h4.2 isoform X2 [Tachysurus fulvidraco]